MGDKPALQHRWRQDIVHRRVGAKTRMKLDGAPLTDHFRDFADRIIEISEVPCLGRANVDTCRGSFPVNAWFETFADAVIDSLVAEIALHNGVVLEGV